MTQAGEARTTQRRTTRPVRSPVGQPSPRGRARSARLLVRRIEPISVLRMSLTFSIALVVIVLVLVSCLYGLLDAMGVFSTVGKFAGDIGATKSGGFVSYGTVIGWTALVSIGLALFGSAVLTLATYVYNLVNDLVGGPELTLTERP